MSDAEIEKETGVKSSEVKREESINEQEEY
jgi:hypothetical protein